MELFTGHAPEHICALFQAAYTGQVEMVNSRGIYLEISHRHVLLCEDRFGTVPNGVALAQWAHLPAMLSPGQTFQMENGVLHFPRVSLSLQLRSIPKDTQIHLPNKEALYAGVQKLLSKTKYTGLSPLAYPLFAGQMPNMNPYCQAALPHVQALLEALQQENGANLQNSVEPLLGLGPGLTPSGDDLLSGLMYGLRHSPARDNPPSVALRHAILEMAPQRTNAVSADYLTAIANDAPFDPMAAAWRNPAMGAAPLMAIGNNSGSEMLLGLMCAAWLLT